MCRTQSRSTEVTLDFFFSQASATPSLTKLVQPYDVLFRMIAQIQLCRISPCVAFSCSGEYPQPSSARAPASCTGYRRLGARYVSANVWRTDAELLQSKRSLNPANAKYRYTSDGHLCKAPQCQVCVQMRRTATRTLCQLRPVSSTTTNSTGEGRGCHCIDSVGRHSGAGMWSMSRWARKLPLSDIRDDDIVWGHCWAVGRFNHTKMWPWQSQLVRSSSLTFAFNTEVCFALCSNRSS